MDAPVWWSEFVLWLKSDVILKKECSCDLSFFHFRNMKFFKKKTMPNANRLQSYNLQSMESLIKGLLFGSNSLQMRICWCLLSFKTSLFVFVLLNKSLFLPNLSFIQPTHNTIKAYIFNADIIISVSENCSGVNFLASKKIAQAPSADPSLQPQSPRKLLRINKINKNIL
jgi:hypothetical protein